ncbi:hypothetical protein A6E15_12255 [Natrinema saccharevitans]|uniref:DUF4897 domain-containing protein n=1 Tax=Natrinema saccharevitans TaxID=301967 RepID=A0A1S8AY61_9EURY|nr:hypothetical protein [Natrinema saccharevitans]OLZ41710.1 hypothetical protein A6E15_12255 [Natrinema saccharevitans]
MRHSLDRVTVVVFAAMLTIGAVPIAAGSAVGHSIQTTTDGVPSVRAAETPEADTTVTRIAIAENGAARWSVTVRTRLENDSDVDNYEAFQGQFRSDRDSYVEEFERRMTGVVSSASESTGRSMNASGFRAETSIQEVPRRWGTVTYSFRWSNFAAVDGNGMIVGDVFEGGLYLGEDDRLRIVPPTGYAPVETSPPPDEVDGTTVVWGGPKEFADRQPTVRFDGSDSAAESDTDGTAGSPRLSFLLGGTLVILAILGVVVAAFGRDEVTRALSWPRFGSDSVSEPTGSPDDGSDDTTKQPAANEPRAESGTSSVSSTAASSVPADLATDEDRVRALLERNGGRMRQAAIAEELEWSASKTSRVVSGMAAENDVEKLRIGRENVIDLLEDATDETG